MQYYYAAIVNHPEIEFNAENNVPLIQIFDTKDMRDKWIRDNAGNPMVMQVSSAQAVKWIKYLFYNHRQSAIPSHLSNHGAVHYFLRDVRFNNVFLHTQRQNLSPERVLERWSIIAR